MAEYIERESTIIDFCNGLADGTIVSPLDTGEFLQNRPTADVVELPPCRIGDDVWLNHEGQLHRVRVQGMSLTVCNSILLHFGGYPCKYAYASDFGEILFTTEEEARAKMDGGADHE